MKNEMIDFSKMTDEQLDLFTKQAMQTHMSRMDATLTKIIDKVEKQDSTIAIMDATIKLSDTKIKENEDQIEILSSVIKDTSIDRRQAAAIKRAKLKRIFQLTGNKGNFKYILFYEKYSTFCGSDLKKKFGEENTPLASYQDISKVNYEDALKYVSNWFPSKKQHHDVISYWLNKRDYDDMTNEQLSAWEVYMSTLPSEEK